jgi:hypothetical protein
LCKNPVSILRIWRRESDVRISKTRTFSITVNLAPGVNTIAVTAVDLSGNSTGAKRTITFNGGTSLNLAITRPAQDITTRKAYLKLVGSITDPMGAVTVTVTMAGQSYHPEVANGEFRQYLHFDAPGQFAISVTAVDAAGNSSTIIRNVIYAPGEHGGGTDDEQGDDSSDKCRDDQKKQGER